MNESELSLESVLAIFMKVGALLEDLLDMGLLDNCLAFLEDSMLDLELALDTFFSCFCLSIQHSKMLCPLQLQWEQCFPLQFCWPFLVPELLV
jgi:hypothetical protein